MASTFPGRGKAPQFQSYQGLHQVIVDRAELQQYLTSTVSWLEGRQGDLRKLVSQVEDATVQRVKEERYHSVRLLDTFFSDSIDAATLDLLIGFAQRSGCECKVLLLDPSSKFAKSRGDDISQNATEEVNAALFNIRNSLLLTGGKPDLPRAEYEKKWKRYAHIQEQIAEIRQSSFLEVRFYELLTEAPIYMVSLKKGDKLFNSELALLKPTYWKLKLLAVILKQLKVTFKNL